MLIVFQHFVNIHTCTHTSSSRFSLSITLMLSSVCLLPACLPAVYCYCWISSRYGLEPNRATHSLYIQTECDTIRFHHTHKSFNHFPQAFSHGFLRFLIQSKHALEVVGSPFFILLFFEFLFSHTEQHNTMTYTIINGYHNEGKNIIWVENQITKKKE